MIKSTNNSVRKHNIKFTKSLGQNFLIDENVINKIVDLGSVTKDDLVIEIGPGIGNMTIELAKRAGKVIAIEQDTKIANILTERLKDIKRDRDPRFCVFLNGTARNFIMLL